MFVLNGAKSQMRGQELSKKVTAMSKTRSLFHGESLISNGVALSLARCLNNSKKWDLENFTFVFV